jgi:hypothetical protein
VYVPWEKRIGVKMLSELKTLNGKEFDPTNCVFFSWRHIMPKNMLTNTRYSNESWSVHTGTVDWAMNSKLVRLMGLPRDQWGQYFSGEGYQRKFKHEGLEPAACTMSLEGAVYMGDVKLALDNDGLQITIVKPKDDDEKTFRYDPAKDVQTPVQKTVTMIERLIEEYKKFIGADHLVGDPTKEEVTEEPDKEDA